MVITTISYVKSPTFLDRGVDMRLTAAHRRHRVVALALLPAHARCLGLASPSAGGKAPQTVAMAYEPLRLHPRLFEPSQVRHWLHPDFAEILEAVEAAEANVLENDGTTVCRSLVTEEARQIFSFPLLRDDACEFLIGEVENFQATGLPARRPNSMNNYGLILTEIGLKPSLTALQQCIQPLARALFPVEGAQFHDFHSFVVSYKPEEDRGLDMHTDDSDVTLNVCLGKQFEAAGLCFCGVRAPRRSRVPRPSARGRAVCTCPSLIMPVARVWLSGSSRLFNGWYCRGRGCARPPARIVPLLTYTRPRHPPSWPKAAWGRRHLERSPRQFDHVELEPAVPRLGCLPRAAVLPRAGESATAIMRPAHPLLPSCWLICTVAHVPCPASDSLPPSLTLLPLTSLSRLARASPMRTASRSRTTAIGRASRERHAPRVARSLPTRRGARRRMPNTTASGARAVAIAIGSQ